MSYPEAHLRTPPTTRPARALITVAGVALALTACTAASAPGSTPAGGGPVEVITALYPLEFLVAEIGGETVTVTNLTPAGAEAHDLELAPADVFAMDAADLMVTLAGFAPAVDTAIADLPDLRTLNLGPLVDLQPIADQLAVADEADHDDHDDHDHEHAPGSLDPHFWLDPERMAVAASAVAAELADLAPEHAPVIEANLDRLRGELSALDQSYRDGLSECDRREIFTSHAAFGYLASRYDLAEVAIVGITPEAESSPARLAEIRSQVRARGVGTLFTEPLSSAKTAKTLAEELGVEVAVLDPIEGRVGSSSDYLTIMAANLHTLRTALDCS